MTEASTTDRVRVLVVDDSDDQADLLRRNFERAGCEVVTVNTAERAITSYLATTPDLVILDLQLPGMNGWQLTSRIRVDRPECAIAITSVLDAATYPLADASLPKPFTGAQVRQLLSDTVPRWAQP